MRSLSLAVFALCAATGSSLVCNTGSSYQQVTNAGLHASFAKRACSDYILATENREDRGQQPLQPVFEDGEVEVGKYGGQHEDDTFHGPHLVHVDAIANGRPVCAAFSLMHLLHRGEELDLSTCEEYLISLMTKCATGGEAIFEDENSEPQWGVSLQYLSGKCRTPPS